MTGVNFDQVPHSVKTALLLVLLVLSGCGQKKDPAPIFRAAVQADRKVAVKSEEWRDGSKLPIAIQDDIRTFHVKGVLAIFEKARNGAPLRGSLKLGIFERERPLLNERVFLLGGETIRFWRGSPQGELQWSVNLQDDTGGELEEGLRELSIMLNISGGGLTRARDMFGDGLALATDNQKPALNRALIKQALSESGLLFGDDTGFKPSVELEENRLVGKVFIDNVLVRAPEGWKASESKLIMAYSDQFTPGVELPRSLALESEYSVKLENPAVQGRVETKTREVTVLRMAPLPK